MPGPADALVVAELAGDRDVASTTRHIPHPYPLAQAAAWIATLPERYERGEMVTYGMRLKESDELIGCIGLTLTLSDDYAEMGYWLGKPYWNNGYCTEAAEAVVGFAFETLGLNRIFAYHMHRNPASGRVMAKLGMVQEGILRRHRKKWDVYEDLVVCGILRSEYLAQQEARRRRKRGKRKAD
jgi:RimJ/RimL family protein N-acetyltransferase